MATINKDSGINAKFVNQFDTLEKKVKTIDRDLDELAKLQIKSEELNKQKMDCLYRDMRNSDDLFCRFVDLYQCKEKIQDEKFKDFEKSCKKYKRNTLISFISCGVIDIILCVLIIAQMYT